LSLARQQLRPGRQRVGLALCTLLIAFVAASCSKESATKQEAKVDPLPTEEVTRGLKACDAYVQRVCECAKNHADMAEECALAKARPEAFRLNLDVAKSEGLSKVEMQAGKVAARKIAAACFEADGRMDAAKCPRISN
jgi:hypothetical protein